MTCPAERRKRFLPFRSHRSSPGILLPATFALFLLAGLLVSPAPCREITGTTDFSGEVVVPKGETWTVRPGSTLRFREGILIVRGTLLVEGTGDRPVRIAGGNDFEGLDVRGEGEAILSHAVIEGGRIGANVTGATARFHEVRFDRNGMGLVVNPFASVRVDGSAFISPLRLGVLVKRGGDVRIEGSSFTGAGKAGLYVFGADNVVVRRSRFEGNETGIVVSMAGARPVVEDCGFRENGTGIDAGKMAMPEVRGSRFEGNRVGLLFSRRAGGIVTGSRIGGNGDGVVVEFSSYPVFRGNRFGKNRDRSVRLRTQSSEWEEERGETDREIPDRFSPFGSPPAGKGGFRPEGAGGGPGPLKGLDGTVDFRENDWGEEAEIAVRGGNLPSVHDGMDEPTFPYRGKHYRMDRVLLR